MDPASVYLQSQQVPELVDKLILHLVEAKPASAPQYLRNLLYDMLEQRFEGDGDQISEASLPPFNPRASKGATVAAKVLSHDLFKKYCRVRTSAGIGLDDCIASGLQYHLSAYATALSSGSPPSASSSGGGGSPFVPYGFLAGDGDVFTVFAEVVEAMFAGRMGGPLTGPGGKSFQAPKSDVSASKVTSGFQFDEKFVIGAGVSIRRNVSGFRMNSSCTRAERRRLSKLLEEAFRIAFGKTESTAGTFYSAAQMTSLASIDSVARALRLDGGPADKPWLQSANREFPDSRGTYVSADGVFFAHALAGTEHVEISTRAVHSHDVRDAFARVVQGLQALAEVLGQQDATLEWQHHPKFGPLFSDLEYFNGYGVTVQFALRLPSLSAHAALDQTLAKLKLQRLPGEWKSGAASRSGAPAIPRPEEVVCVSNANDRPFVAVEADVVQNTCAAILKLIEAEESVARGGGTL